MNRRNNVINGGFWLGQLLICCLEFTPYINAFVVALALTDASGGYLSGVSTLKIGCMLVLALSVPVALLLMWWPGALSYRWLNNGLTMLMVVAAVGLLAQDFNQGWLIWDQWLWQLLYASWFGLRGNGWLHTI